MVPKAAKTDDDGSSTRDNLAFIREMLGQLRQVAESEGADLLCYFLEMAYVEAGDLQAGRRPFSVQRGKRH